MYTKICIRAIGNRQKLSLYQSEEKSMNVWMRFYSLRIWQMLS